MDKKAKMRGEIRPPGFFPSWQVITFVKRGESSMERISLSTHFPSRKWDAERQNDAVRNFSEVRRRHAFALRSMTKSDVTEDVNFLRDTKFIRGYTRNRIEDGNMHILSLSDLDIMIFSLGRSTSPLPSNVAL